FEVPGSITARATERPTAGDQPEGGVVLPPPSWFTVPQPEILRGRGGRVLDWFFPYDEAVRLPALGQQDPDDRGPRLWRCSGLPDGVCLVRHVAQNDRRGLSAQTAGSI